MMMIIAQVSPNGGDGILDTLIAVFIILLILSLINEKIVELIRKYSKMPRWFNWFDVMKNINQPYTEDAQINEKKKREINLLAILVGIGVAALAKASLFDLLSNKDPQSVLFWSDSEFPVDNPIRFVLGIIFTGFFLSFGTKFFHDLLDVLYQTKEYKRKLQSNQLRDFRNISDLQSFIHTDSLKLAKKALGIHGKEIKKKYGDIISSMQLGNTVNNQIGIIVNLKTNPPPDFPKTVSVKLPNGGIIKVEVETNVMDVGKAQFGLEFRLQNPDDFGKTGALGGILVSSKNTDTKYLLTCSHVALGGRSDDLGGFPDSNEFDIETEVLENGQNRAMGKLIYAKLDNTNDTAIVELNEHDIEDWNNELPNGHFFEEAIPVSMLELAEEIKFYSSLRREEVKGVIHKLSAQEEISLEYDDLKVKTFVGLIVVGNNLGGFWSSISEKGDSGAILYDENHAPFGLIIGGSHKYTYAIPLFDILNSTNIEILTS